MGLASGQDIDARQLAEYKEASGNDKAYGNALRYVAIRPRSLWEVETYLRRKGVDSPAAAAIIKRLQGVGLLDDLAFGRAWVANRRLLKDISGRRLRLELQQKRLAEDIIDTVLAEDDTDERDALRALIAKKRPRYADDVKLMQYLARQGFGYDDIKAVLNEGGDT